MPEIRFYVDDEDKRILDNIKFDMGCKSWKEMVLILARKSRTSFENVQVDMVINALFNKYHNKIKNIIEEVIEEEFLKKEDGLNK